MAVGGLLVVYMGIPNQLMGVIAEHGLGNLSKVYKAGIRQELSVEALFAGMTARGIMASLTFQELGGSEMAVFQKGGEPCVTAERLDNLIMDLFQHIKDSKGKIKIDRIEEARKVRWAANKRFEISKFKFKFPRARTYEMIGLVLGCIEAKICKT